MRATQITQPTEVMDALRRLAHEIGYEVVVQPGPMNTVAVIVWEIATVSLNARFPIERQAEELVCIMALLVERLERDGGSLDLTFCQQAQVVDAVAAGICAELDMASGRTTSLEIAGVWDGVDPTTAIEARTWSLGWHAVSRSTSSRGRDEQAHGVGTGRLIRSLSAAKHTGSGRSHALVRTRRVASHR